MMAHKDPVALTSRALGKLRVSTATIHIFLSTAGFNSFNTSMATPECCRLLFCASAFSSSALSALLALNCPRLRDAAG
jgi:hypothetical protein